LNTAFRGFLLWRGVRERRGGVRERAIHFGWKGRGWASAAKPREEGGGGGMGRGKEEGDKTHSSY
jgi:hypothetical protein